MSLSYICLVSIFFLFPGLSSSSCPWMQTQSRKPCNNSIEIRAPFFVNDSESNQVSPSCDSGIRIKCTQRPRVYLFQLKSVWFVVVNISYAPNKLIVRDPLLEHTLQSSSCGSLLLSFPTTSHDFDYQQFISFTNNITSFCGFQNLSSQIPILGKEYTLNYSAATGERLPTNCYRKAPNASFEWAFSFQNDSSNVSLLSAQYSYKLLSQPGCFTHSISGGDCGKECNESKGKAEETESTGKKSHSDSKAILIGITAGLSGLLIVCGVFVILLKNNKLKCLSSSSKLLMRRDPSDRYFHDLVMAGSQYTQIFSYEELEEATDGFNASNELGEGGFGTVYKGNLRDGRIVAVKRLYKNNYKRAEQFMNEVEILSRLHHPNLVALYGCTARTSQDLLLVYEFVPNGTVADHLHGSRSSENILTWPIRLSIAIETADALSYLHAVEPHIVHRDVKTNNILLDDSFHVKVGDFGLSRNFPLDVTHVSTVPQGTPGYVDPVYYQCYQLTDKSDVYSFGVVLVELISSKPAVDMKRSGDEINLANMALNKIQRSKLDELVDPALGFQSDSEMWQMVSLMAELAFRCLQSDRDMRPSIKEALEILRWIQKGGYDGEKIGKASSSTEEAFLFENEKVYSPNTVINDWKSQLTTPNTSS